METVVFILSIVIVVCGIATLMYVIKMSKADASSVSAEEIQRMVDVQTDLIQRQVQLVREELSRTLREQLTESRMELSSRVEELRKEVSGNQLQQSQLLQDTLNQNLLTTNTLQREKLEAMTRQQEQLVQSTEKRLDDMRLMVEEKLQKTLNERIGQSFELVRTQLENVQQGLGEMKSLAQDVGGLKRVLTNVKTRGTFGEVQLAALLEQMLSPEQYEANVKTKRRSTEYVEYAVKLPGKEEGLERVYLPIDAKFPSGILCGSCCGCCNKFI